MFNSPTAEKAVITAHCAQTHHHGPDGATVALKQREHFYFLFFCMNAKGFVRLHRQLFIHNLLQLFLPALTSSVCAHIRHTNALHQKVAGVSLSVLRSFAEKERKIKSRPVNWQSKHRFWFTVKPEFPSRSRTKRMKQKGRFTTTTPHRN